MDAEQKRHQQMIGEECDAVKALLLQKNADYGGSFAKAGGAFCPDLTAEQKIGVRIQDKIERISTGRNEISEDTEQDLIGYPHSEARAAANRGRRLLEWTINRLGRFRTSARQHASR